MTDAVYILDSSAVLAAFFAEPGADLVAERMNGALLSAVNHAEVVTKLVDRGIPREQIIEIMAQLDIDIVPFDREQATIAGLLRAATRTAGLSLGDRACLALAMSRKGVALTTDRVWTELEVDAVVELVR